MPRPKKLNKEADQAKERKPRGARKEINSVTGMRDILPQDQKYWQAAIQTAEKVAMDYGFGRIDTPILESLDLFTRGVGKQTDIVEKEMFSFIDQGGDNLALRPEGTAPIIRSYIQHGMLNQSQPVKLFYVGPMFRHDRPQSGRYRQFYQFGFEAIGEASPTLDAQLILMGFNCLNDLGIESVVQVNSIGCPVCREEYKKALVKYYKAKVRGLCESCKNRLNKNPLRLLDCKEDSCQEAKEGAPQILDYLDEACKKHFMKVLEYLDELDLPYALNPTIVRGLDYYNKTIFEFWSADDSEGKVALGGGGRYDGLVALLGGREDTPSCGLAMGVDRIVAKLREKEIKVPDLTQPDIFLAQLGESAKKKAMALYEKLRKKNIKVAQAFYKDGLKAQLELANKLKVKFTLILGQKEFGEGTIILRDMEGGIQEIIDFNKIDKEIAKRLEKYQDHEGITLVEENLGAEPAAAVKKFKREATADRDTSENDSASFNYKDDSAEPAADDFFGTIDS
jgi:histidyl-tRNA synthetase